MELRAPALWMSRTEPESEAEAAFSLVLQKAVAGDIPAFEQIVARYERRVLTLALRLLGNIADAQDASQDVFLRAFRFLHRFDAKRRIEPWLVRMTVNVCRDLGKKRRPSTGLDTDIMISSSDPHAAMSSEESREILYRALSELPVKERAAIVLRDLEGLSTAEVAETLGSSEATVRSQISTARLKIRKSIESMSRRRS
jgi:RNA polymerase sigma-70 factor, ECF subfamily